MNHEQLRFDDMQLPPIELVAQNEVKSPNPILSNPHEEVKMTATERYFQELGGQVSRRAGRDFTLSTIEQLRAELLAKPDFPKK